MEQAYKLNNITAVQANTALTVKVFVIYHYSYIL